MSTLPIKRALVSVSEKSGLVGFVNALRRHGVEIISTGGTAKLLGENEIELKKVDQVTGHPEILNGRVKTLHPKIHGGILADRRSDAHMTELELHEIAPIDLVVCNLYPFEKTIARADCTFDTAIENIDIGGPCMVRAAAKNHQSVAVVVDPTDYGAIIAEMDETAGSLSESTRRYLARKAFRHTADYDTVISNYLEENAKILPDTINARLQRVATLRYGENPHQQAALYRDSQDVEGGLLDAVQYQGKELSYNNYLDLEGALDCVRVFKEPTAVVVKHTNPCGVASAESGLVQAYLDARATDETSSFGGIVGLNRIVDADMARLLCETFLECVIAPDYTEEARFVLKKKKNLRILAAPHLEFGSAPPRGQTWTRLRGGLLVQERDQGPDNRDEWRVVTERQPTEEEWKALEFGWTVVRFV
ncbi:MAG: bifunctional phosphoribosylaminoimidazolecarboxamide formyltransferase/IMP cyclohydrolase, partial [Myxococcales bacterium]|nr:bifunctional phosphoribosylaminoimidazolecarboxamide formyltransferase/IMP cyclohydrolase [Myxococcales bacterium]